MNCLFVRDQPLTIFNLIVYENSNKEPVVCSINIHVKCPTITLNVRPTRTVVVNADWMT